MYSTKEEFDAKHPYPDTSGVRTLFRFFSPNLAYLECLFKQKKLYHSLPSTFNDPFECKPNYKAPSNRSEKIAIRKHLIRTSREHGLTRNQAELRTDDLLKDPINFEKTVRDANEKAFGEIRICCFTKTKENLLFWAHYADSHRGICVEFDASITPVSFSFKVDYTDNYPTASYPVPVGVHGIAPAFIKSEHWKYEEEYRSVIFPTSKVVDNLRELDENRESVILDPASIKAVYFGSQIAPNDKNKIIRLISDSSFSPELWDSSLSKERYKLHFSRIT